MDQTFLTDLYLYKTFPYLSVALQIKLSCAAAQKLHDVWSSVKNVMLKKSCPNVTLQIYTLSLYIS